MHEVAKGQDVGLKFMTYFCSGVKQNVHMCIFNTKILILIYCSTNNV